MTLYFLRHAMAGKRLSNPTRDERRPLDKEGIEQCAFIGRLLAALDIHPDVIISSPLKRATQTASLVGNELGYEDKLQTSPALAPSATYENFRDLLRSHSKEENVIVVGHNPNLSQFLSLLVTNGTSERAVELKKGAVARVDYSPKKSVLEWLITPKVARTNYSLRQTKPRPKTDLK